MSAGRRSHVAVLLGRLPGWRRYGIPVAAVAVASLVRAALSGAIGADAPFLLFSLAVLVSTWYGGAGPGLFATALSSLTAAWVFMPPAGRLPTAASDLASLGVFVVEGILLTLLGRALHRAQATSAAGRERALRAEAARDVTEEGFRLLVESVRDYAIFRLDPRGRIVTWNAGAERIKGYRADEILGEHISRFYTPERVESGEPERELREATVTGRFEDEGWRVRKDGSRFWASVVLTALCDEEGRLVGFAKVTRDLTERRRAEEERLRLAEERAARVQAEAAVRLRDDFLARASHELRTPLTVIKGYIALIGKRLALADTDAAHAILAVQRHVDHMTRLIAELLDASRLEGGYARLEPQSLDLAAIARDAVAQVQPMAAEKGVRLDDDVAAPLPYTGDPLKLEQVLVNLLTNAVKFTPAGGMVHLEGTASSGLVELRVRDSGAGIAPEHLERIFEPFYQIGSAIGRRKASGQGVGLGLAIVRRLVELHGGRVWAESPGPGRGSTFVIRLPVWDRSGSFGEAA